MKHKPEEPRRLSIETDRWSAHALREAQIELREAMEMLTQGSGDEEDLDFRLGSAIAYLAKAWHARGMTDEQYDSVSDAEVRHMLSDIPMLGILAGSGRAVPSNLMWHELPSYDETH